MVCLQSGSVSAHGVILCFYFFFLFVYLIFRNPVWKNKKKKKKKRGGGYLEDILLEGFWVMSWPVVMSDASW